MMGFLEQIRVFVADSSDALNIGAVMHQFIRDEVIPKLEKKLQMRGLSQRDRDKIEGLIEDYKKYSDPRTQESRLYSHTAMIVMRALASSANKEVAEDFIQNIARDMYVSRGGGLPPLANVLSRFDVMGGPLALNKAWSTIIKWNIKSSISEMMKDRDRTLTTLTGPEGDGDYFENVPAESSITESEVNEFTKDMYNFIRKSAKNKEQSAVFNLWIEAADKYGPLGVNVTRDIVNILKEKEIKMPASTVAYNIVLLKKLIVRFAESQMGPEMAGKVKRMMKVGAAESIVKSEFRARIASWIISGIIIHG